MKTYYLIFAILKDLGFKINFTEYANVVFGVTRFSLKRKTAGEIKKIYQAETAGRILEENEAVKMEENSEPTSKSSLVPPRLGFEMPAVRKSRKKGDKKERVELSDSELKDDRYY